MQILGYEDSSNVNTKMKNLFMNEIFKKILALFYLHIYKTFNG